MSDPDDLRDQYDEAKRRGVEARKEEASHLERAEAAAERARRWEQLAAFIGSQLGEATATEGLTIAVDYAKVRRMSQPNVIDAIAKARKAPGRPIKGKHALQTALKGHGMTMSELARVLDVPRNTVKSWVFQRIPAAMAKRIEDLLGVPATLKSWPAGIQP